MKVICYKQENGKWVKGYEEVPWYKHYWYSFQVIKDYYITKLENYYDEKR